MMLRRQNNPLESGIAENPAPLFTIQGRGVKKFLRFASVAPLAPGERIDPEMDEGVHTHFLPRKLPPVRKRSERRGSTRGITAAIRTGIHMFVNRV